MSEVVAARMGLHFPGERWRDLERGIQSVAREFDFFEDAEKCARWLLSSPLTRKQIESLAGHLTIGETYFYRESKALDALKERILPALIQARRGKEEYLRIWSAGCSTGEEAYSVAILLDQQFPEVKNWQVDIIATDVNARALRKASAGIYREWSFRDTPALVKESYFERRKGDRYEIHPRIKRRVNFFYLNLSGDAYPSAFNNTNAMDVIFCRNVLMYFSQRQAKRAIVNFSHALVHDGWLIVSPSELSSELFSEFQTVNFSDAILYRKTGSERCEAANTANAANRPVAESAIPLQPPIDLVIGPETLIAPFLRRREPVTPARPASSDVKQLPLSPYAKASVCYQQGHYDEAAETLLALLQNEPEHVKAVMLLARADANQGNLHEALQWCEKAIALDKTNAVAHFLRGTVLQEQHQAGEAIKSLRCALYLDQNYVLAHFALGSLTRAQGKLKEAEKHFANALALLSAYHQEDILPESEGLTAGRLFEIIRQAMTSEAA